MDVTSLNSAPSLEEAPPRAAIFACMLAGMCTFLNVYCTQPLLPYLQRVYNSTVIRYQPDGQRDHPCSRLDGAGGWADGGIDWPQEGHRSLALCADRSHPVGGNIAEPAALIFWRFMQGLFVPGVIVVMMAYINEEFAGTYVGRAMSAYISGTVLGGFLGRYISGFGRTLRLARRVSGDWHLEPRRRRSWCSGRSQSQELRTLSQHRNSIAESWDHLRNPRLLAVFGMGFAALFCLVGVFTYVNFYLAAPPFRLNSAQLGSVFCVYLLGVIVTPLSGRFLDHYGVRHTALLAFGFALAGLSLTLIRTSADHRGAGDLRLRRLHLPGCWNGANRNRRSARAFLGRRTLRDVLLHRRKPGCHRDRLDLARGRLAGVRIPADGRGGSRARLGVCKQPEIACPLQPHAKNEGRHCCRPAKIQN